MAKFGLRSLWNLRNADPQLKQLMNEAIKEYDFAVICSTRGRVDQEKALSEGRSKAKYGQSPHNYYPSLAVDIAPYPIDWDVKRAEDLAEVIKKCAVKLKIRIEWGGEFSFRDLPHFQLADWKKFAKTRKLVGE